MYNVIDVQFWLFWQVTLSNSPYMSF